MAIYHFIGGDNKQYGPYSLKTMRAYRTQNRLNDESMVKKDGGKFQPAANFEELALAKKKKAAKKKSPSSNYNLKDYSSFVDPLSVRKLAVKIVTSIDKKYSQPWHQAAAIFDYVKKNIRYVRDPRGIDYVASPSETIECGGGDCDDHAVLISSLCEAVGIRTRLVFCVSPGGAHLLCQVGCKGGDIDGKEIGLDLLPFFKQKSIDVTDNIFWDTDPKDPALKWIYADTAMCRYFGDSIPLVNGGFKDKIDNHHIPGASNWRNPTQVFYIK